MNPVKVDRRTCHERRHMTPSEFMTYDAMRAMAESADKPQRAAEGYLLYYGRLTTLTNHTSISRNQNRANISSLINKGWMIPEDRLRWRAGQFGVNRYALLDHEQWWANHPHQCPAYKYESKTGALLIREKSAADLLRRLRPASTGAK